MVELRALKVTFSEAIDAVDLAVFGAENSGATAPMKVSRTSGYRLKKSTQELEVCVLRRLHRGEGESVRCMDFKRNERFAHAGGDTAADIDAFIFRFLFVDGTGFVQAVDEVVAVVWDE